MRVLFVDDEQDLSEQARVFLEKEVDRLKVETRASAEEGLELLEEDDYDAIVSDYQMPGMSGLEFLKTVRKDRDSNIPFIIFTGKGREEVAMEALNLGADRYLQKGGDPESQYGVLADAVLQEVEHRRAEERLKRSEEKFRRGFGASPDPVFLLDEEGVFEDVNEAALEILGFDKGEIVGSSLWNAPFIPEVSMEVTTENFERRKKGEEIPPYVVELRSKDGESVLVEVNVGKLESGESFEGEIVVARDITEQERIEERLRKSQEKYRLITEETNDLIAIVDRNGEYVFVNEAHERVLGLDPKELVGKSAFDLFHPDDLDRAVQAFEEGKEKGGKRRIEARLECGDGSYKWFEIQGKVLGDGRDRPERGLIVSRDISERKRIEERLRESERKYRVVAEGSSNGIYVFQDGEFKFVNESLTEMTGYSREELKSMNFLDLVHPDYREDIENWTEQALTGDTSGLPEKHEFVALRRDGGSVWVQLTPSLIDYDGRPAIVGNVADITERKRAEEKLRKSREKYRTLTETADEIILAHGMGEIGITYANKGAAKQLGYEVEELLEMNLYDLLPEDEVEKIREIERRRKAGDASVYRVETKALRKDGTVFPVKASSKPISVTDSGKPEEVLVIARNITSRKEAEEREDFLHSLLRHDVRNKAQIVRGYLELIEDYDLPEEVEDYLSKAEEATESSVGIIEKVRTLRDLSETEEMKKIELRSLIQNVIDEHEEVFSESVFELECEGEEIEVQGGPFLEELFSNLIENAVKHTDCDKIKISSKEEEDMTKVTVEDDGKGIPDDIKDRVFEKGFNDEETGGSGLGLYLVREIAENYGGSVEVKDSELGGARFDVHLQKAE